MARYIEAVKTAEIISKKCGIDILELVDIFAEIPTADVESIKRGSWVSESQDSAIYCSECGDSALLNGCEEYEKSNYCPNCGAKMDLESED